MKKCTYCGKENSDEALHCSECGTEFKSPTSVDTPAEPETPQTETASEKLQFVTPTPEEMEKHLVTLLRCRTLVEADLLAARLESAGIHTFLPDQFLMQSVGWNLNTFGYVRIQVSPNDYEAAKEFLSEPGQNA
jgi:Putative prokaryotic signal transducing protein/zinc-ribbon domain